MSVASLLLVVSVRFRGWCLCLLFLLWCNKNYMICCIRTSRAAKNDPVEGPPAGSTSLGQVCSRSVGPWMFEVTTECFRV